MLQVTIDMEALGEHSALRTFDVVSIGHHSGICVITFCDPRSGIDEFDVISTDSIFFKGLL